MNSKNIETTKSLGVNVGSRKDMINIQENDERLLANVKYELVASDDWAFNSITSFKKGEKKMVTGLLAEQCILYSEGIVTLVNARQEAERTRDAEIDARLAKLEAAKAPVEEPEEVSEEPVKAPTPKPKTKKAKKKVAKD